jgi:hypothetical protein
VVCIDADPRIAGDRAATALRRSPQTRYRHSRQECRDDLLAGGTLAVVGLRHVRGRQAGRMGIAA